MEHQPYEVQVVPLDALVPAHYNPRRVKAAHLKALTAELREFGLVEPLVANRRADGSLVLVSGHQRLKAARDLGWPTVPVHVVALDEAHERALNLALNNPNLQGQWDPSLLGRVVHEIAFDESLLGLAGFSAVEAAALTRSLEALAEPDEPAPPDPPEKATTRPGEVVALGPHRLMCGDSTKPGDVRRLVGGDRAACCFMDPPYAIYGSSSGVSSSVSDDRMVRPFFRDALAAAQSALAMFGTAYVCCDWRSWPSLWEAARETRLEPKNLLVWDKGSAGLGANYANVYELIGYFVACPPQRTMKGSRKKGVRPILHPNLIREVRVPTTEREHNAAKPVDLIRKIVEWSTKRGDVVVDLFAGSGSTLVAAERSGRRCLAMEVDPRYCDVIRARYEREAGRAAASA